MNKHEENKVGGNRLKYRSFYTLGDSLSDNGAFAGILDKLSFAKKVEFCGPFYQERSFSNGPMAVEYLARYLGVEFKPGWEISIFDKQYEEKGQDYAISCATASECSGSFTYSFLNKFRLANQLSALIEHHPDIGEEDLILIMIGGNDIMFAVDCDHDKAEEVLRQAVLEICNTIKTLSSHSVRHIIVVNAPDIGSIPAYNKNEKKKELATKLTDSFNVQLIKGLEDIKQEYTNLEIKQLDLNAKLKDMIDQYKTGGLNYQDACVSDTVDEILDGHKRQLEIFLRLLFEGKLESHYTPGHDEESLNKFLFFDYFHPTAKPHEEVGDEMCRLIGADEVVLPVGSGFTSQ